MQIRSATVTYIQPHLKHRPFSQHFDWSVRKVVPESNDSVIVSQNARYRDLETEIAKWNSAIFYLYLCFILCQNVVHEKGPLHQYNQ